MTGVGPPGSPVRLMDATGLSRFVDLLVDRFDTVIGPVVDDGVVRLRPITTADQLPLGVTDHQEAGSYRLVPTGTALRFSYGPSPDSLKDLVQPPEVPVWTMTRTDGTLVVEAAAPTTTNCAVIGARACDVHALAVLARTQTEGRHRDPDVTARRDRLFIAAVDCTHTAPTCFCDSAGHGRVVPGGVDLALTEFADASGRANYLVRCGSAAAEQIIDELDVRIAPDHIVRSVSAGIDRSDNPQVRTLCDDAADVVRVDDHPRWTEVADRCLTCGNCTAVCPTCFCTDVDDRVSLDRTTATRSRIRDTCFSLEYSRLGPGPQRASPRSRYRQWLSHKFGTWHDQFGESGCVGCGRCITWCPVGIDVTVELRELRRPVGDHR